MDFLSNLRSKKISESGVWISDEEVLNCGCCGVRFSLLIRKHHCRVSDGAATRGRTGAACVRHGRRDV